jgi:NAD(P)-dependent dehydrogenase (short-subunit alcohol dehydrogenase family)
MNILITGCSSGFGASAAAALAADGHRVFASMRDPRGRNAGPAARLGALAGDIEVVELDVSDGESISAAFAHMAAAGGLDAVVHNAGVAAVGPLEAQSPEQVAHLFDVNVVGAVRVQHAALPLLRRSASPRVVVVTSTLARERAPLLAAYTASKHALDALFECWSHELNPDGIRTVLVQPGTVPTTRMLDNLVPADRPTNATGALAARAEAMVAGLRAWGGAPDAPDASRVADAIRVALSECPPRRIVIDPTGFDGAERINLVCDGVQADLLERYGMQDLAETADR